MRDVARLILNMPPSARAQLGGRLCDGSSNDVLVGLGLQIEGATDEDVLTLRLHELIQSGAESGALVKALTIIPRDVPLWEAFREAALSPVILID